VIDSHSSSLFNWQLTTSQQSVRHKITNVQPVKQWLVPTDHTHHGTESGLDGQEYALSARQRLVLRCLVESGGVSDPVTLSVECASRIHNQPADRISPETRRRLFHELATPAVESLERQGLVEYDEIRGTVTLRYSHRM